MKFYRPVFITSSPNTSWSDVLLGLKLFFQPWKWENENLIKSFESELQNFFKQPDTEIFLLDSGRSALFCILESLGIGEGDEVIVPAFTCLAVANPIHWSGAKPIYVDVDKETFNMDLNQLEAKITPRTKAIIAQHTFGEAVDMNKLKSILGERKIVIIEDCAHSLGGSYKNQPLGTIGEAAILGFGIDKAISGVRGGAAIVNLKKLAEKGFLINKEQLEHDYAALPNHPLSLALKCLLNPLIWHITTPLYFIGVGSFTLGKGLIRLLYKLKIVGNVVASDENVGDKPNWMPAKISPVLANLAHYQLNKLAKLNEHRRAIAQIYASELGIDFSKNNEVYQKFSLLIKNHDSRKKLYNEAKSAWFIIGDWLPRPLYAKFSSTEVYKVLEYKPEENPVAEEVSSRVINLPTSVNIDGKRANLLANIVKKYI